MKKILGISLCALFAVSAANAEITSKDYVDGLVGANTSSINTLTGRVNGHDTTIQANTTAISGINTNIGNMDATATTGEYVKVVSQTDGKVSATGASFEDTLNAATQDNAPTSKAVADHVKGAINALDVTAIQGDYIKAVSQADGKVSATPESFDDAVTATSENAPTSAAVATYVDNKVSGLEVGALEDRVEANESAIGTNTTDIATNASDITTLTGRVDTNEQAINGHTTAIAENVTKIGENATKIGANTTAITNLTSDIQGMDLTATTGDYVQVVSQANGTVQATGASFATNVATGGDIAPTSTAVVTYVRDNAVQSVTSGTNDGTIKVDGQEVSVAGLGSAAYEDASTFANATSLKALAYKDTVTSTEITDGTIGNDDIATNAAIASSKIVFNPTQTAVFGSGITSNLVADINSNRTSINAMLTEANGYDTCKASTDGCTLVVKNRQFYWEAIKRAEGEGAE